MSSENVYGAKNDYLFQFSHIPLQLVDMVKKTRVLPLYHDLNKSQWLTPNQLEELQRQRTMELLVHAAENVPYYRELFRTKNFDPHNFRDFADMQVLPVLDKKTVRENYDRLMAGNAAQFRPRRRQTSGSTGQPLVFCADEMSHSSGWANSWRAFSTGGFQPGDPFIILTGGALLPNTTPIKQRIYTALMGMKQLPAYHLSPETMEKYVAFLRQNSTHHYMYAYPHAAALLARFIQQKGGIATGLKGIFVTSEVLSPGQRETIQEAFGCPVYNTYGNNETTVYAFECDRHDGLHYSMEHSYLEVLDADDKPCKPGETGRFVATNLFDYAMPFIRYDTGDLGVVTDEECACGRGLKRIRNILGRSRDFVYTPDGRQIHGAFFNHFDSFYTTPWISAWHVKQHAIDHITISFCPDGTPVQNDIHKIDGLLKKALGENMRIDYVMDEKLKVTPAGKLRLIESCFSSDPSSSAIP
jgi:phenylacetate-CoA ligase